MVFLDALAIECSFLVSYWLRFQSSIFDSLGFSQEDIPPIDGYILGSLVVVLVWVLLFNSRRMYRARRNVSLSDELVSVVRVVTLGMLIVMSAAFFYREFSYSRIVFGLLWVSSIGFIFSGRALVLAVERALYRKARNLQQAIILGNAELANQVYDRLNGHEAFGFSIAGYFGSAPATDGLPLAHAPYLGSFEDAPAHIRGNAIDLVFIAVRAQDHPAIFELIAECEGLNIEFLMVPDMIEILTSNMRTHELEGIPFVRVKSIPLSYWGKLAKRSVDVAVAGVSIILLSPVALILSLLIRLDSRGPIFFRQERVGLDGTRFTMFKFRSMQAGADRFDDRAGLGVSNDSRRTRLGALLRKTSLDELPQLYNVLKGDMSLVGPRPERIAYVKQFQEVIPKYLDRHRVKTGMTGWAQVNGLRGDTSISERIKYDLYYIENWSLTLDLKILLRTLKTLIHPKETA